MTFKEVRKRPLLWNLLTGSHTLCNAHLLVIGNICSKFHLYYLKNYWWTLRHNILPSDRPPGHPATRPPDRLMNPVEPPPNYQPINDMKNILLDFFGCNDWASTMPWYPFTVVVSLMIVSVSSLTRIVLLCNASTNYKVSYYFYICCVRISK